MSINVAAALSTLTFFLRLPSPTLCWARKPFMSSSMTIEGALTFFPQPPGSVSSGVSAEGAGAAGVTDAVAAARLAITAACNGRATTAAGFDLVVRLTGANARAADHPIIIKVEMRNAWRKQVEFNAINHTELRIQMEKEIPAEDFAGASGAGSGVS